MNEIVYTGEIDLDTFETNYNSYKLNDNDDPYSGSQNPGIFEFEELIEKVTLEESCEGTRLYVESMVSETECKRLLKEYVKLWRDKYNTILENIE